MRHLGRWVDETRDYARQKALSVELSLTSYGVRVMHRCASITVHWPDLEPAGKNPLLDALKALETIEAA